MNFRISLAPSRVSPIRSKSLKNRASVISAAPPPAPRGRGPVILPLGPRNFGIAQWTRDEGAVPVYRITHKDIRAASTAATMARQASRDASGRDA
jgi:hypothetical protein